MNTPNISVLDDTVVVRLHEKPLLSSESLLKLPDNLMPNYMTGVAVVTGDSVREIAAGDIILFHKDVGRKTQILGDELVLVKERNVFLKIIDQN